MMVKGEVHVLRRHRVKHVVLLICVSVHSLLGETYMFEARHKRMHTFTHFHTPITVLATSEELYDGQGVRY